MKQFFIYYMIILWLTLTQILSAQEIDKQFMYNDIEITYADGKRLDGFLSGIQDDSLHVIIGGNKKSIYFRDIQTLGLHRENRNLNHATTGFLGGILLGNILFYASENEPTAYIDGWDYPDGLGLILINFLFGAAGMGVGYLFDIATVKQISYFNFPVGENSARMTWNSFKHFIWLGKLKKTVHLSFHTGQISMRIRNKYKKSLKDAGLLIWNDEEPGFYNFLRKVQLLININDNMQTGAAIIFQGEPSLRASGSQGYAEFKNDAVGYYGVFQYQPFKRSPLYVGAAIGILRADWRYQGSYSVGEPFYEYFAFSGSFQKDLFSSSIYCDYHILLNNFSSLALSFDHSFTPVQEFPKIPELFFSEYKSSYGNTSFGVALGLHF